MILTCHGCGIEYNANHRGRKYCTYECYRENNPAVHVSMQCQVCNKEYFVNQARAKTSKHCSWKCNHEALRGNGPRVNGHSMYQYICKACGKRFLRQAYNKNRVYCSNECTSRMRQDRVSTPCATCGKTVTVKRSRFDAGKGRYCSKRCYYTGRVFRERIMYTRGNGGKRADLDNTYFRSSWEANYARILNYLMDGYIIRGWEFEAETFDLGDTRYMPDFKVTAIDETIAYHEVKGYMRPKAKRKLDKMAEQYPDVSLVLIAEKQYRALEHTYGHRLPNWE